MLEEYSVRSSEATIDVVYSDFSGSNIRDSDIYPITNEAFNALTINVNELSNSNELSDNNKNENNYNSNNSSNNSLNNFYKKMTIIAIILFFILVLLFLHLFVI